MKITWSPRARRGLYQAYRYIAEDSEAAAGRLADVIDAHVRHLRVHPAMGRPGRIGGTRELVVPNSPFNVVYELRDREIRIIALMHGAQAWPDDFDE